MTYSSTLSMSRGQYASPVAARPSPRSHYAARNQNAVSFESAKARLGPVSNTIILVVLACLLGLLYLTQVTKTNAYGYQINGLREKQTALLAEQNDLQLASARLQSLDRVKQSETAKGLIAVAPSTTLQN